MSAITTCHSDVALAIARHLLDTEAVKLSPEKPFKWSSGWLSPIYCDNRVLLSFPSARKYVKEQFCRTILDQFPQADAIAGVATAGIAQGALVAERLILPFLYVRPKPKEHGMGNQIEGRLPLSSKVVVLEDLVSTGGSSLAAVAALREAGANVLGMVSVFNYGFSTAEENFNKAGVKLVSLSDYDHLLKLVLENGSINAPTLETMKKWRIDPSNWGK